MRDRPTPWIETLALIVAAILCAAVAVVLGRA